MAASVLLDTSFLISLVDRNRPNHSTASQYYRFLLNSEIPMYFSSIVASEFEIKQPITDLPIKNFRHLPFNIPHGRLAGRLWGELVDKRDAATPRHVARDDVKLIAQAYHERIGFLLTEDKSSMYKYCQRLKKDGEFSVQAVVMAQGFDDCAFRDDGQRGFGFTVMPEPDN